MDDDLPETIAEKCSKTNYVEFINNVDKKATLKLKTGKDSLQSVRGSVAVH